MMVDLVARGDQRHAGYAASDGGFVNAALVLARDLLRLDGLFDSRAHPVLGRTTATPTMLDAGVSRNVTPPVATAILDIRSTPDWTHDEIAALLREHLDSEVVVTSRRLVPCETPAGSQLLAAATRARPEASCFGSPTCSDWVFLRHVDAVKAGLPKQEASSRQHAQLATTSSTQVRHESASPGSQPSSESRRPAPPGPVNSSSSASMELG
jgi:hypothetical protein